ncbi:HD-GYP domain-containing protein [Salibacterium aidingense]|uniref:HD-GYP domain-containing protein n=1 Tax=Salibacterium aidingense TaxID=384933 RepID=UPI003BD6B946
MKVKREQLKEGCILTEDVFAVTSHPIIRKKTILTAKHLEVLEAFLIHKVHVEKKLIDGTPFQPPDAEEETEESRSEAPVPFLDYYLKAVQTYKALFQKWTGGSRIEMDKIRGVLAPLAEKLTKHPNQVLFLHHFSTKEDYLYHHAVSTALLAMFLARKKGFSKKERLQAGIAGALCDAGMARLPAAVLYNKEHLTEHEYEEVKNHPYYSYNMVKEINSVSEDVLLAVLQHHEREDGSGYPLQVKSDKIHKLSKIVSTADVYHAMTSEHYYRKQRSPYKVIDEMSKDQFGRLDPETTQLLMHALITFSIGTKVRLSNGAFATIIYVDEKSPAEPIVQQEDTEDVIRVEGDQGPFIEEILSS